MRCSASGNNKSSLVLPRALRTRLTPSVITTTTPIFSLVKRASGLSAVRGCTTARLGFLDGEGSILGAVMLEIYRHFETGRKDILAHKTAAFGCHSRCVCGAALIVLRLIRAVIEAIFHKFP